MNIQRSEAGRRSRGFTLVEAVVAMLVVGVITIAAIAAINFSRAQLFREKDRGIVSDFLAHYLELVRSLPFSSVQRGGPINGLYDGGANSVTDIRIPGDENWRSLTQTNYVLFHPELAWLSARHPEMRVHLDVSQAAGTDHTKRLQIDVRWDAPLNPGQRIQARLDMIRTRDL